MFGSWWKFAPTISETTHNVSISPRLYKPRIAARSTHDLSPLHAKGLTLHVTFMALKILHTDKRNDCGEILNTITQIVEEEKLRPLLDSKTFTFDEIAQAHEYLESNKAIGKIVLKNVW